MAIKRILMSLVLIPLAFAVCLAEEGAGMSEDALDYIAALLKREAGRV